MEWSDIWTFAEQKNGKLHGVSFELLTWGRALADARGCRLCSVVLGASIPTTEVDELVARGADRAYMRFRMPLEPDVFSQDAAQHLEQVCDDPVQVHPCNGESAFKGFQIMMAICRSAVQRGKVFLPLGLGESELGALKGALP